MRAIRWSLALPACMALGCGSSGGGASFAQMKEKFDKPTGELKGENSGSVATALAETDEKGNPPNPAAGTPGGLSAALDCRYPETAGGPISCACPSGGTVSYTEPAEPDWEREGEGVGGGEFRQTFVYAACASGAEADRVVHDGVGTMLKASHWAADYVFSFRGTAKLGDAAAETVASDYYVESTGEKGYLVTVGGTFVVSGTFDAAHGSGQWKVKDATGVFQCAATGGAGSCTGPGGKVVEVGSGGEPRPETVPDSGGRETTAA